MPPAKFQRIDVRPLLAQGTDPFAAIRDRIDKLPVATGLTVIAPFLPAPLIELLRSEGYATRVEHRADGGWAVSFWRE
jgi:uncharacterized protein (DUF2249 family)